MVQPTAATAPDAGPAPVPAARRPPRGEPGRRAGGAVALLWIGPALVLILGVVIWPVIELIRTSLLRISRSGRTLGFEGIGNYLDLFAHRDLPEILLRTLVWVVGVVAVTLVLSLGLGQLLNQRFPGRTVVRWAVIVPWAASVLMTALIWRWMLNNYFGLVNQVLMDLGILEEPVNWLARPTLALLWMMWVAVFVSLPFTSFVILAGLQAIPDEVHEAARIDGAGPLRAYFAITLPLLRPALLVGSIINVINVFNSFPIIWAMTQGGPGHATDTTTTFMYKLAVFDQDVGTSAAMAVVNFLLIVVMVLLYLRAVRWREEIA